jgi:hypothetical protein
MKFCYYILAIVISLQLTGCKNTRIDAQNPDNNGKMLLSMDRTGCYGKCPIYQIRIYENGFLYYNAVKFVDTTGKFFAVLTKKQLSELITAADEAHLFEMKDEYPDNKRPPADLPSHIVAYHRKGQDKKIIDRGIDSPKPLVLLESRLDGLLKTVKLQNCDK